MYLRIKFQAEKILTKFSGKHLCQSVILNEHLGLQLTITLKLRLQHKCFLRIFLACKFIENKTPVQVFPCELGNFFQPVTLPKIRLQHICFLMNLQKI